MSRLFEEKKKTLFPKNVVTEAVSTEDDDCRALSPDVSAIYDGKGSVPAIMQLLRKAIAEETKSINDYSFFLDSGYFSPTDKDVIQEILNDEKDHIVKFTNLLSKATAENYKDFGKN